MGMHRYGGATMGISAGTAKHVLLLDITRYNGAQNAASGQRLTLFRNPRMTTSAADDDSSHRPRRHSVGGA